MKKTGNSGFTLIELMFAVAIIAILSVIAYPSYHNSIRVSRRVDAKQALMEAAHKLENYYARNARYTTDLTELGYPEKSWTPVQSASANTWYQITINDAAGCNIKNCYMLESRSIGDQTKDVVSAYKLWSTGRKQIRVNSHDKEGW